MGSDRLAISRTVRLELSQTRYDDKRERYEALVADLPVIDDEVESVVAIAEMIFAKYEDHDDPPDAADAFICAAAIDEGLTVVTENWRDFHFIEEIQFLDVREISRNDLPVLQVRQPQPGQLLPDKSCCRNMLRKRRHGSQP